jgi:hypothetical protein
MIKTPITTAACLCLAFAGSWAAGCTLDDVSDEIVIVENVPAPDGVGAAHRLSRRLSLGEGSEAVSSGHFTGVSIEVTGPPGSDLSAFLRIDINVDTGNEVARVAQATDFTEGELSRELTLEYTGDIKPFLSSSNLEVQWEVYYRTGADYPAGGIDLETVISFDVDITIL